MDKAIVFRAVLFMVTGALLAINPNAPPDFSETIFGGIVNMLMRLGAALIGG